ncbi:MAG: TldD/PmbA family protein [Deltaproteobacteria bacterium]|nr:MAG: TldD/PmbA family protein [Deltaproteobacteria bacterium]
MSEERETDVRRWFERNFGVTEEVVRGVLSEAMSRGGDFADLYFQHTVGTSLSLEDGAVNKASTTVDLGVGIRVVSGDATGYAFTEDLSPEAMRAAARTAAGIAAGGGGRVPEALTPRRHPAYYDVAYDWAAVELERLLPLVEGMSARAHEMDEAVRQVQAGFGASQTHVMVVDSEGRVSADNKPMTRAYLSVVMEKGGVHNTNYANLAAREGLDFYTQQRLDRMVKKAVDRTRILFEARKPPQGELPVVLAAGSSGILLHEAIGHGMEADFNRKGKSIFSDKIGQPVAEPFVSIVDDGTNPGMRGSINFDDEGTSSQRTVLVEGGILRSYMHDRISARHYGVEPTGSGRRQSFRHAPLPRMRNTYMLPGPHTKEEIIRSVKKGVYAVSFTNGQVNIGAGDYAFYVKNGWLIEDGRLTAPIRDVNLIGNGPESLARITMVGDDFEMDEGGWTCGKEGQSVPVSLGMPTVKVSAITVGGSK